MLAETSGFSFLLLNSLRIFLSVFQSICDLQKNPLAPVNYHIIANCSAKYRTYPLWKQILESFFHTLTLLCISASHIFRSTGFLYVSAGIVTDNIATKILK